MAEEPAGDVVIIGGGFAGLYAAKALGRKSIKVSLIDRRNYHLIQPLLYRVAAAALSRADVAEPIRKILRPYGSVSVATGVDRHSRQVTLASGRHLSHGHLIVATGATHSYFHVYLLTAFQNRGTVSLQWLWRYLTAERGARLIIEGAPSSPVAPEQDAVEPMQAMAGAGERSSVSLRSSYSTAQ